MFLILGAQFQHPLHLWSQDIFRKIGDCCEGFIVVDEGPTSHWNLQWARLLVRPNGKATLRTLQVVEGLVVIAIQL